MRCVHIKNKDASPTSVEFAVSAHAIHQIVSWYSSHHEGDDFFITVDGEQYKEQHNYTET